ncbi:MAG TPA: nucleotidyl transferase AbiEii/AbiGii toxin family protein, partial [Candidatus Obscuribacterales bacterium]
MSRFDAREVAVKGGFGVRTLVSPSPYTADIDMLIDKPELQGMNQDKAYQVCTAYVLENLMAEGEDHFHFQPTGAAQIIGLRADHAVAKIYVQVAVGDGSFTSIQIDAGMKPQGVPVQQVSGRDVLGFADIPNPHITTASREYIAGDKISLFLETGMERPRDLVHAALLLEEGKYDPGALGNWIEKLARYRGVEGKLLSDLPEPVGEWLGQVE